MEIKTREERLEEELAEEYEVAMEPDFLRLANLIKRAKGVDRTMAEFAKLCGVSASTFSRITNFTANEDNVERRKRRISVDLAKNIIRNADERSGVCYFELMQANGMRCKREYKDEEVKKWRQESDDFTGLNNLMKSAVMVGLLKRQYQVEYVDNRQLMESVEYNEEREKALINDSIWQRKNSSFMMKILNAGEGECDEIRFAFGAEQWDTTSRSEHIERIIRRMVTDNFSAIFLVDAWEPERYAGKKISFVFSTKYMNLYEGFVEFSKKVTVNSKMSVLLVDVDMMDIVEETEFPRR